jgi:hypothetical protein
MAPAADPLIHALRHHRAALAAHSAALQKLALALDRHQPPPRHPRRHSRRARSHLRRGQP